MSEVHTGTNVITHESHRYTSTEGAFFFEDSIQQKHDLQLNMLTVCFILYGIITVY